jgi:hypothetical protein
MRHALFGVGVMLFAASAAPAGAAPPPCWQNGAEVPCDGSPGSGLPPQPTYYYPPRPKYPPSWYYNPYNVRWMQCHLCGE